MSTLPPALFAFLSELAQNNEREWFQANKKRYERDVKGPALAFIEDFQGPLADVSPHFLAVPKAQGGSLFRIYRDTRFSKDKTPYKTNTGLQFRHERTAKDVHAPGFYLHIEPGACGVGCGLWMPPNPVLNTLRTQIVEQADRWAALKEEVAAAGFLFMDSDKDLKRVPRGFDRDHVHADDLRRKSLAIHSPFPDEAVCAEDFADQLAARFAQAAPLVAFTCEALGLPF